MVAVKIEVLAPNQRPIQVPDDLSNFWREQYPKIKPELSRRYPRPSAVALRQALGYGETSEWR
jgi:HrpA-like RNA helicase